VERTASAGNDGALRTIRAGVERFRSNVAQCPIRLATRACRPITIL
jgi:hypothetical protein